MSKGPYGVQLAGVCWVNRVKAYQHNLLNFILLSSRLFSEGPSKKDSAKPDTCAHEDSAAKSPSANLGGASDGQPSESSGQN